MKRSLVERRVLAPGVPVSAPGLGRRGTSGLHDTAGDATSFATIHEALDPSDACAPSPTSGWGDATRDMARRWWWRENSAAS